MKKTKLRVAVIGDQFVLTSLYTAALQTHVAPLVDELVAGHGGGGLAGPAVGPQRRGQRISWATRSGWRSWFRAPTRW